MPPGIYQHFEQQDLGGVICSTEFAFQANSFLKRMTYDV